jgi:uncharacterized protein (TIGR00255 family)
MSLKSMTGYGKGEARQDDITVTVEIKTVNHRYADISVKLPRTFLSLENGVRKQVAAVVGRGKVDVYVNYELASEAQVVPKLNNELAVAYHKLFVELAGNLNLQDRISIDHIINQRDVVRVEEAEIDESTLESCLRSATAVALESLLAMRATEGEETRKDIDERLNVTETILAQIEQRAPQVPAEWQERLTERLERLQQNVEWDPQRVAQEIAVYTDRCDISEEITRFKSHLVQFRGMLDDQEPVGRRMDFLVQELNREVNTMGSKSNDAELTTAVVTLKSELEKIREQVQNIE